MGTCLTVPKPGSVDTPKPGSMPKDERQVWNAQLAGPTNTRSEGKNIVQHIRALSAQSRSAGNARASWEPKSSVPRREAKKTTRRDRRRTEQKLVAEFNGRKERVDSGRAQEQCAVAVRRIKERKRIERQRQLKDMENVAVIAAIKQSSMVSRKKDPSSTNSCSICLQMCTGKREVELPCR